MVDDPNLDRVRDYYAQFGEREWNRLANPDDGVIEFAITRRTLRKYLPPSGRILDIGGGPGRYTIWLAENGYRVAMADLSPNLIDIARSKVSEAGLESKIESISVADARDLSAWEDNSFDGVLSLGPFYHLVNATDREEAAKELVRVLRPGAPAFVAMMPRYAFLRRTMLIPDERHHLSQPEWLQNLMVEGRFENDVRGRFNSGYGVNPSEVSVFFEKYGLTTVDLLATESISVGIQGELAKIAAEQTEMFEKILDLLESAASDSSIHGVCSHLLYVGRKVP
jgi:S-adenosylmethionine-dependent methyltransferase